MKECCVIVYNSFLDPLVQNLMLKYIKTLNERSGWKFHLITFEQPEYSLTPQQKLDWVRRLKEKGIIWHAKRHHTGKFLVLKKAYDFISIGFLLFKLKISGVKVLWSFANVAASIAWVYSVILGFKTVIYSYEPHSQFMAELGIWKRSSLKFKILNYLEWKAGIYSDFVMTGTQYMVKELVNRQARGKLFRAPTSVDEGEFYFRVEGRSIIGDRHGFSQQDKLILYIGKFGDLYYTWQIPFLFKELKMSIPAAKFIVISPTPYALLTQHFEEAQFDISNVICLSNLSYEDVKLYISASNLGISAVPPTPSQRFRSPTKVAEYLLCGLPYLTCEGVSEDDLIAIQYEVGVVLKDFTKESIKGSIVNIDSYLNIDRQRISERCRMAGLKYRAKSNVDLQLKTIFNDLACNSTTTK